MNELKNVNGKPMIEISVEDLDRKIEHEEREIAYLQKKMDVSSAELASLQAVKDSI